MLNEDDPLDREGTRRGIQSVEQAADLLRLLADAATALPLRELAAQAGMGPSSAHRYLVSLQRCGLVRQDPNTALYDLGPQALRLGLAAIRRLDVMGAVENAAQKVAARTRETTFVAIWNDHGPVVVRWYHGKRVIITTAGIGSSLPLLASSTGRVFAAFLPPEQLSELLKNEDVVTRREREDAERILAAVRQNGYAWIDELVVPGLRAIAVPTFNSQGQVVATMTVLSTDKNLVSLPNATLDCLVEEARNVSADFGWVSRPPA